MPTVKEGEKNEWVSGLPIHFVFKLFLKQINTYGGGRCYNHRDFHRYLPMVDHCALQPP